MKEFYIKAEAIEKLQIKESKSPNSFAQKNAKDLEEFIAFAKATYFKMQQITHEYNVLSELYKDVANDLLKDKNRADEDLIKKMWAKSQGNPEAKANLKKWADLIIEERKYIKVYGRKWKF